MKYIKTINQVRKYLNLDKTYHDKNLVVPTKIILDYLELYELGIPEKYYYDGIYGIRDWLKTSNFLFDFKGNTYEENGQVEHDFSFQEWESLEENCVYVIVYFHLGNPFSKDYARNENLPIVLKFEAGTSFFQVLDNISLENNNIPYLELNINNNSYIILPRIMHSSYFVFNTTTGEELYDMGIDLEEIKEKLQKEVHIRLRN